MAERDEFELPVPISNNSDYKKISGLSGAQTNCRDRRRLNRRVGLATFEGDLPPRARRTTSRMNNIATDVAAAIQ
jgi:hypothetical protein